MIVPLVGSEEVLLLTMRAATCRMLRMSLSMGSATSSVSILSRSLVRAVGTRRFDELASISRPTAAVLPPVFEMEEYRCTHGGGRAGTLEEEAVMADVFQDGACWNA